MRNVVPQVLSAITNAVSDRFPDVFGLTSPKIRAFLNGLVSSLPENESYLEVGTYVGGTLIPALADRKGVTAYACENWAEPMHGSEKSRDVCFRNIAKYKERLPEITFIEKNCFDVFAAPPFRKPIGIYFYDGDHSAESHYKAIVEAFPVLASQAIIIVDDYSWPAVLDGTWRGIRQLNLAHLSFHGKYPRHVGETEYHNGLGIFYIEKK